MKATFTAVERIENALRTYTSDMEIHELDNAFPKPELKVDPQDLIKIVTYLRKIQTHAIDGSTGNDAYGHNRVICIHKLLDDIC